MDALVASIHIKDDKVWRKGEIRSASRPDGKANRHSGATFIASDADFEEFETQVVEATRFLVQHRDEMRDLVRFDAVDHATLDFGIELRDVMIHSDTLTPELIAAAAAVGVSIELSHYPGSKAQTNIEQVGDLYHRPIPESSAMISNFTFNRAINVRCPQA
ncbi:MAG: hypothetical protein ACI8T1_002854 [Verrucomicrobiales bacterium]|jgi:hypothetical protein